MTCTPRRSGARHWLHARVNCVECHMGRVSTLKLMALKPTHMKELWGMIVGYERPLHSSTLRPSREACEGCHWPSAEHHDSIATKVRYGTDPESSEAKTTLVLHTGVGAVRESSAKGVHWHVMNEVEFVSLDPQRREIPWVQVKRPDGTKVTYIDADSKATAAQMSGAEKRTMACYDCHNSAGHPLENPEFLVDELIRTGKIDRALPATKSRAIALITASEKVNGKTEERAAAIDKLLAESAAKAATPPEMKPKEELQQGDEGTARQRLVPGEGIQLEVLPRPPGPHRHAGLLPLPRRQALQREG